MRRLLPYLAVTLALIFSLGGCSRDQSPASPASEAGPDKAVATESATAVAAPLYVTPAKIDTCDRGEVVVVHWDMRQTHPEIADVEIWTGPVGNQTLFAAGGFVGEASTGQPWASPGTTFTARNKADGTEVATVVVGGPTCPGT